MCFKKIEINHFKYLYNIGKKLKLTVLNFTRICNCLVGLNKYATREKYFLY